MNKELHSILFTLIIVAVVIGGWLIGRNQGWFVRSSANDINICRNATGDTLYFNSKNPIYTVSGWSASRHDDDILHVDLKLKRNRQNNRIEMYLDTANVRYVEIYGKVMPINDIPFSK